MTRFHTHSPSNHAPARARLDNSLGGHGDALPRAFYSRPTLAETGPSHCTLLQRRWGRHAWFGTALFWLGEILGAASLFIIPIIGLLAGDIFR